MSKKLTSAQKYDSWSSTPALNWSWACKDAEERNHDSRLTALQRQIEFMTITADAGSIHEVLGHPWVNAHHAVKQATKLLKRPPNYVLSSRVIRKLWVWEDAEKTWRLVVGTTGPTIEIGTHLTFVEGALAIKNLFLEMGFESVPETRWHQKLKDDYFK